MWIRSGGIMIMVMEISYVVEMEVGNIFMEDGRGFCLEI